MHIELEQRLGCCGNLPSLPGVAVKLIDLANDPEVELDELAQVISMDPALAARLLRAANSPLYGLRRKTTNLRQVVNLLGSQGTLALALGFSLIASSREMGGLPLNTEQFWGRALVAATACRLLGERLELKNRDELFLAGLLHGIGILALAVMMPDRYGPLLSEASAPQSGGVSGLDCQHLAALEQKQLQMDHAAVGAWLLKRWNLPDYLSQSVLGSLEPDRATLSEEYRTLAKCVSLAARLADIWVRPGYWRHSAPLADLAEQLLGLNGEEYVGVLEAISEKFPELADLFKIKILDTIAVAGILDQAREILSIHQLRNRPFALGQRSVTDELIASTPPLLPKSLPVTATTVSPSLERDTVNASQQYAFDTLTGLFNRPQFEELLRRGLGSAKTQNWPLSVALLAVDEWKSLLEAHGRAAADQILIALGRLFGANIRRHDLVARYSSIEFAFLLPSSEAASTRSLLERLQDLVRQWQPLVDGRKRIQISISVGFVSYPEDKVDGEVSAETLLKAAEQALRQAQHVHDALMRYGEGE